MRLAQVSGEIVALQAELVAMGARAQHIRRRLAWLRLLRAVLSGSTG